MPESAFQEELGTQGMADPREAGAPHSDHPSAKEYIRIGVILAVLTALEVATYWVEVEPKILIPSLWILSIIKFSMVVMWFMHLKFDARTYSRFFIMGIALACTLYLIVLITFKTFGVT